jgi:hypothetical protein
MQVACIAIICILKRTRFINENRQSFFLQETKLKVINILSVGSDISIVNHQKCKS